jgi:hypothetical protein
MVINVIKIALLITAVQFILSASCNKERPRQCRGGYVFQATSEWSPQKRVYGVGDTLYLSSTIPKTLTDGINPSIVVDYSNSVAIGGGIGMGYVDTIQRIPMPGRSKFDFFPITGTIGERAVAADQGPAFTYAEQPTSYGFRCGIICKQKGIYVFSISDLKSPGIRGKDCTNADFGMTLTNSEKNLDLYEVATGITLDADGRKRGFAFRVQ